jgi:thiamine-monophosphate kinase
LDSTTIALSGGEDYELLFAVKTEDYPKIKANPHLTVVGHLTDETEGMHLISRAGTKIPLVARGWNALKNNNE